MVGAMAVADAKGRELTANQGGTMVLRNLLLTVHILGVIVWLGFGAYELLLSREIRRSRGTPLEAELIRIYGRYAAFVAVATLVVAATGALMSVLIGWGFFTSIWLGAKQAIMLLVLAVMVCRSTGSLRRASDRRALRARARVRAGRRCRRTHPARHHRVPVLRRVDRHGDGPLRRLVPLHRGLSGLLPTDRPRGRGRRERRAGRGHG